MIWLVLLMLMAVAGLANSGHYGRPPVNRPASQSTRKLAPKGRSAEVTYRTESTTTTRQAVNRRQNRVEVFRPVLAHTANQSLSLFGGHRLRKC